MHATDYYHDTSNSHKTGNEVSFIDQVSDLRFV